MKKLINLINEKIYTFANKNDAQVSTHTQCMNEIQEKIAEILKWQMLVKKNIYFDSNEH